MRLVIMAILILFSLAVAFSWILIRRQLDKKNAVLNALNKPNRISFDQLMEKMDADYAIMDAEHRKEIMDNPRVAEDFAFKAMNKELDKSLAVLFSLPSPIRKKLIEDALENFTKNLEEAGPDKVKAFIDDPAGRGMLRGAANYFLLGLDGAKRKELSPLADKIFEALKSNIEHERQIKN